MEIRWNELRSRISQMNLKAQTGEARSKGPCLISLFLPNIY